MKNIEINDSNIDKSVLINDYAIILKSEIAEKCSIGRFSKIAYSKFGTYSYIGDYTIVITTQVGKYTSISWGVTLGPEEHNYSLVTNHSFLYSTKTFKISEKIHYSPFKKKCTIGNDVWIGCNSTILRGVAIGDGAVIGANSLVTKDIPPYAIAVGSPANVIKYRFDGETINRLLKLKWWDLPELVIKNNIILFASEPTTEILTKLEKLIK